MSAPAHRAAGDALGEIPLALVTVSDTRTPDTDVNGRYLAEVAGDASARVVHQAIVPDEPERVGAALDDALRSGARAVLFNGGTGIAARDTTFDALSARFERTLPGFGELFRMLSWEQVGAAAMLSRAAAGVVGRVVVFCVPGSPKAVRLAWERLIAPELGHLVAELDR